MDPKALKAKPVVPSYLGFYVTAFWLLSRQRCTSLGSSPISLESMLAYLSVYRWYDPDEFIRLIIQMDDQYLECKNVDKRVCTPSSN